MRPIRTAFICPHVNLYKGNQEKRRHSAVGYYSQAATPFPRRHRIPRMRRQRLNVCLASAKWLCGLEESTGLNRLQIYSFFVDSSDGSQRLYSWINLGRNKELSQWILHVINHMVSNSKNASLLIPRARVSIYPALEMVSEMCLPRQGVSKFALSI